MRFLLLIYPGLSSEDDWMPDAQMVEDMTAYTDRLQEAGVLLALEGLHPTAEGARLRSSPDGPVVENGPFPNQEASAGGLLMIRADSRDEAVEWASQCPFTDTAWIEVRRIFEPEDLPPDVQQAAHMADPPPRMAG